jgi:hypothetical protein
MHRGGSDKRSDGRCKQTNAESNRARASKIRRPSCVRKPERNKQARVVRRAIEHPQPPMRWIVPRLRTRKVIHKSQTWFRSYRCVLSRGSLKRIRVERRGLLDRAIGYCCSDRWRSHSAKCPSRGDSNSLLGGGGASAGRLFMAPRPPRYCKRQPDFNPDCCQLARGCPVALAAQKPVTSARGK